MAATRQRKTTTRKPAAAAEPKAAGSMLEQVREVANANREQLDPKQPHRTVFRAITEDGERHEVIVRPIHLGAAIDHPKAVNEYWATLIAGWVALGEPAGDFMTWAETVDWMTADREPIPPTRPNGRRK